MASHTDRMTPTPDPLSSTRVGDSEGPDAVGNDRVREIVAGLTKAQRWFICALSASWTHPADIGANPNHGSYRDPELVEASTDGQGREYRLTPLGRAVRAALQGEG